MVVDGQPIARVKREPAPLGWGDCALMTALVFAAFVVIALLLIFAWPWIKGRAVAVWRWLRPAKKE